MIAEHLSLIGTPDATGAWAVHGSAAVLDGKGVLFLGPSGSGKSSQVLSLLALGAGLVADDRVLVREGPTLVTPPDATAAIEARTVGLLHADLVDGAVPFALAVDLAKPEPERLPPSRYLECGHGKVPLILGAGHPNLAPVVVQYLRKGRYR